MLYESTGIHTANASAGHAKTVRGDSGFRGGHLRGEGGAPYAEQCGRTRRARRRAVVRDGGASYRCRRPRLRWSVRSPSALEPLGEVRALRAEGGVVPVPGVEPRLVGELVEHPGLQVVDQ